MTNYNESLDNSSLTSNQVANNVTELEVKPSNQLDKVSKSTSNEISVEGSKVNQFNENLKENWQKFGSKCQHAYSNYNSKILFDHIKTFFSATPSKLLYLPSFDKVNTLILLILFFIIGALTNFLLVINIINRIFASVFGLLNSQLNSALGGLGSLFGGSVSGSLDSLVYSILPNNFSFFIKILLFKIILTGISFGLLFFVYTIFGVKTSFSHKVDRLLKIYFPSILVQLPAILFIAIYPIFTIVLLILASLTTFIYFIFEVFIVSNQATKDRDAFWVILASSVIYFLAVYLIFSIFIF